MAKYRSGEKYRVEGTLPRLRSVLNQRHVNTHDRQLVFRTIMGIVKDPVQAEQFTKALLECPKIYKKTNLKNSELH